LVSKEENERWVRAPPNCNPFDMRASFTCSSLSCRVRGAQATYGRNRLNTATGIERPTGGATAQARQCPEIQVPRGENCLLTTDCRQLEDGCFSSHLRWISTAKDASRSGCSSPGCRPVVYVPVPCEPVPADSRGVSDNRSKSSAEMAAQWPSTSSLSSPLLMVQQAAAVAPDICSRIPATDTATTSNSGITSGSAAYIAVSRCEMRTDRSNGRKFEGGRANELEEEKVEERKEEGQVRSETGHPSSRAFPPLQSLAVCLETTPSSSISATVIQ
uniref:Uncharacterized protein n=1 Tax=Gongylonema pulchrum TaxID=637853 RepID=A0A183DXY6_9BILA